VNRYPLIAVRLEPELETRVRDFADRTGVTVSAVMRWALRAHLGDLEIGRARLPLFERARKVKGRAA